MIELETPISRRARRQQRPIAHIILALLAISMMLPFLWMLLTSFKPIDEAEQYNPLPSRWEPANYSIVLGKTPDPKTHRVLPIDFKKWYFNSVFVAAWVTFLQVLTSAMAAYAFARLHWPGRDTVFKLYLATLMIPGLVTMIPNYALMVKLHLLDSYAGLIIPAAFSAFGTFLLRQFMLTLPASLDEAAGMDGATHWQVFWDVILPLARPGVITLAVFTFMGT